jgi:hypothetical protein
MKGRTYIEKNKGLIDYREKYMHKAGALKAI